MSDMTPHQALRYLEQRVPKTDNQEQAITDELAFETLWNLVLKGRV